MQFTDSFWYVFHRIFRWRPIVLGCCDCNATFYLSKNKIIDEYDDNQGNKHPVVKCPYCGMQHCIVMVQVDENTKSIKFEAK